MTLCVSHELKRNRKEQRYACWVNYYFTGSDMTDKAVRIRVPELKSDRYTVDAILSVKGYPTQMHIPLVLIQK